MTADHVLSHQSEAAGRGHIERTSPLLKDLISVDLERERITYHVMRWIQLPRHVDNHDDRVQAYNYVTIVLPKALGFGSSMIEQRSGVKTNCISRLSFQSLAETNFLQAGRENRQGTRTFKHRT